MIASPLTELLKKDAFRWSTNATNSFVALKAAMSSAPVLRLPNFEIPFVIETDTSDFGVGAVLLQEHHPIAYFSKKLGPKRRLSSTYHKELYAIVEAVQKWRQYLLGREFIIRSDQRSLKELVVSGHSNTQPTVLHSKTDGFQVPNRVQVWCVESCRRRFVTQRG